MDLLKNLDNMITAEEFAELNQYDLEYYDEGGCQGIEIDSFAQKLIEFTKLHVTEALKYNREYMPQSRIDKYLEENIK